MLFDSSSPRFCRKSFIVRGDFNFDIPACGARSMKFEHMFISPTNERFFSIHSFKIVVYPQKQSSYHFKEKVQVTKTKAFLMDRPNSM
jgi:hypothetical protein